MSNRSAAFRERLRVPFRWWLQGGLLVASFWVAMIVALPEAAAWGVAAAMMAMLAAALRSYGGARIVVEGGWLHAGRAKIELKFVGLSGLWTPPPHARCGGRSRTHARSSC